MKKYVMVVGARPQFVKYSALARALARKCGRSTKHVDPVLVHTGQHYDYRLSKIFFEELGIPEPRYNLEVGSGSHGYQTGEIIRKTEKVLLAERPDGVVVFGDTNSTMAAALAAAKMHIPVIHIESGLRSFNKRMPEEINRIVTDEVSSVLFCPSTAAVRLLKRANGQLRMLNTALATVQDIRAITRRERASINAPLLFNVGDVMFDVLLHARDIALKSSGILSRLGVQPHRYAILTMHREENTSDRRKLREIVSFVNTVRSAKRVIFPMHPRTVKHYEACGKRFGPHVRIVEPVGYFDMLALLSESTLLMTDSGGMQKEAFWLRVPCITLREETEWTETVESGWNVLYRDYQGEHVPTNKAVHCYGDGRTAERIAQCLAEVQFAS